MKFLIKRFKSIDSTNTYLKKHYQKYPAGTIIIADHQTHGRGRENRRWIDKKGDNLTFSILLKPNISYQNITKLTLLSCASIFEVLKKYTDDINIKWPNDILINYKKICGILTEAIFEGNNLQCVIIGIGININNKKFPNEISNIATSLFLETNQIYNLDYILNEIIHSFDFFYQKFLEGDYSFINICRQNFHLIGKTAKVKIHQEEKEIIVLDICENGNLLVNENGEIKEFISGEIKLKHQGKYF